MGISYYPKLIIAAPFTPATGERLVIAPGEDRGEITRLLAGAVVELAQGGERGFSLSGAHVLFPREAELASWQDAGFVPRYGVQYHWRNRGYRTWDDFLGVFNSKRRNQLKREAAQPAKDGVTIETLAPGALDDAVVKTMHRLYAGTVDKFYYGRRYLNPRFFALVAERFAHRLAWVVAKKDGAIIAGAFNVKKGKALYGRYWGVNDSAADLPFLHFNVCYYHGIRECIAEGLEVFEPGAGGEHKRVRGFEPTLTFSGHWLRNRRFAAVIEEFLGRERAAVQAHVRGDAPEPDL
jgi:predicted N-acyltransferase